MAFNVKTKPPLFLFTKSLWDQSHANLFAIQNSFFPSGLGRFSIRMFSPPSCFLCQIPGKASVSVLSPPPNISAFVHEIRVPVRVTLEKVEANTLTDFHQNIWFSKIGVSLSVCYRLPETSSYFLVRPSPLLIYKLYHLSNYSPILASKWFLMKCLVTQEPEGWRNGLVRCWESN